MRITLLLALLAAVGVAGAAEAHYIIEQDTPVGTVCALNEEVILEGLRAQDPGTVLEGVFTTGCD